MERIQWDIERQVKKTIQTYSKKLVVNDKKEETQKIMTTIKGLED